MSSRGKQKRGFGGNAPKYGSGCTQFDVYGNLSPSGPGRMRYSVGRGLMGKSEKQFRERHAPELTKPGPMAEGLLEKFPGELSEVETGFLESIVDSVSAYREVGQVFHGSHKQIRWLLSIHERCEGVCPTCGRRVEEEEG